MEHSDSHDTPTRRALLQSGLGAGALLALPANAFAAAPPGFDQWRDNFRARAHAKGVSDATYTRVMGRIEPDMSVFKQMAKQPEFHEQVWQYVNRRASDWRITAGKEALGEGAIWLKDGMNCTVMLWNGVPLNVTPPAHVELKIVETDPGLRGDTATGGAKPAKLETGAVVRVPLFINEGEIIRVDTRTGEYLSRGKG